MPLDPYAHSTLICMPMSRHGDYMQFPASGEDVVALARDSSDLPSDLGSQSHQHGDQQQLSDEDFDNQLKRRDEAEAKCDELQRAHQQSQHSIEAMRTFVALQLEPSTNAETRIFIEKPLKTQMAELATLTAWHLAMTEMLRKKKQLVELLRDEFEQAEFETRLAAADEKAESKRGANSLRQKHFIVYRICVDRDVPLGMPQEFSQVKSDHTCVEGSIEMLCHGRRIIDGEVGLPPVQKGEG